MAWSRTNAIFFSFLELFDNSFSLPRLFQSKERNLVQSNRLNRRGILLWDLRSMNRRNISSHTQSSCQYIKEPLQAFSKDDKLCGGPSKLLGRQIRITAGSPGKMGALHR